MMSCLDFVKYWLSFKCQQAILTSFKSNFDSAQVAECHGPYLFKLRVRHTSLTPGLLYAFIEQHRSLSWRLEEYSVS